MSTLDEILSGKEPTPPPAAPDPTPPAAPSATPPAAGAEPTPPAEPPAAPERKRGPDGRFIEASGEPTPPAEPPAAAPPKSTKDMSDKEKALLAAAMDERNKRQALEKRLAALEKSPGEPETPKTFWDDPDEAITRMEKRTQDMLIRNKLDTTEAAARHRYPDFDERVKVFGEVAKQTPGMVEQWVAAPDPAEFAYRVGKNYQTLNEAGSIDKLREKIEKEVRIKIEAEFKKKEEDRIKEAAKLPGSLSDVPGGNPTKPAWSGPTPLETILKGS